jgi:hypothetical protein
MATVVVSGAIANKYLNGGEAWVRLSWVLGLRKLGVDVYFVEQIGAAACVGEEGQPTTFDRSANKAYFDEIMERFGLTTAAALVYENGEETSGVGFADLLDVAESADLLINISGHLELESLMRRLSRKAYVDLDPGFTQLWHATGTVGARLEGHDHYFTVGVRIGAEGCSIPTGGFEWRAVMPPVVLDEWPVTNASDHARFTTVGSWRGAFGPIEHDGSVYGLKVHEFRKVIDLPRRSDGSFEIALDIHPADSKDREALIANGWRLADPRVEARDPDAFRRYVQGSGAEFSVAQGMYVQARVGWFSDRTVRYLASGKPALVQDTGFGEGGEANEGLVAFRTVEEATTGAARIVRDYDAHARAARSLAERLFDSDKVLPRFLDQAGVKG